ncbi:MAG TPA: DUF4252 domain-containing protein [Bryobacteraceae bacterium]|nr:DUF4252 domain-containing protein [Bryobacteraceae bacterium]
MKRILVLALLALGLGAQDFQIPVNIEKLAAKAVDTVDVTLDASMLQFAGTFLSDKKPEEAQARQLINGLKGIYVRSFEFEKPGEYSAADVEAIRVQLKAPLWSRIVGVRSKREGENAEVFLKRENNKVTGLAVIAADPKSLTIVNIVGAINPEDLSRLGGQFGIPRLEAPKEEKK